MWSGITVELFNALIGQSFTVLTTTSGGIKYMGYLSPETVVDYKKIVFDVYLRKSTEDSEDKQVRSIPGQKMDIEEQILGRYGFKVNHPYYEESQTAFKQGRPFFAKVVDDIESGKVQGVIVWHANRIARNYGDGGPFVQMLMDGKIKVVVTCFGIFENNPRDLAYLMDEFTRAARDSGEKSEAVKRGNKTRFLKDKLWIGVAKPGYLNYTDPITKVRKIIVDESRYPLIEKSVRLVLNGSYTAMQALNKLNDEWGYRSRLTMRQGDRPMSKSGFYRLLADPYLYGKLIRKEGEIMSQDKAMTTQEEFDRLQIILGKRGRPQVSKHEFAFKEVLKCGECGGSITCEEKWHIICSVCHNFKFAKGKKTTCCPQCKTPIEDMDSKKMKLLHYVHYHCARKVNNKCTQKCIELKVLEKQVNEALDRYEIPEIFKDWAIEHLNELNDAETSDREIIRKNAKDAYDNTVKRLDNLLRLKISPQNSDGSIMSEEEYTTQRKYLLAEKDAFLKNMNETDKRIDSWHELSAKTFNFACYAKYWFEHGDLKIKTEILGALGSNLRVFDKNVLIDGYKHFFLIEKSKQDIVGMAKMLEPEKWMDILGRIDVLEPLRPSWLRD